MSNGSRPLIFRINDHGAGPEIIRQVFLERGWVEFDEDIQDDSDWNIWWRTSRFRTSDYGKIYPWQRLNHYPKSTGITRKDCLVRNLRRMKGVHGTSVFNFSPLSFNLPNDYTRFVAEYGKMKAKVDGKMLNWICKPADLSRGRGIFVFRDISELQYDCNAVLQRYISNPLLIGGYKFDIRIYVAVPSFHPLTVYVLQEGLVRFSTEKFDLSTLTNIFAHLTNTSINKHSPSYTLDKERIGPGCKWTITQLRHYFHQSNLDDRVFWTRVTNIIILTLLIQAPQVPKEKNCFELYGFDILIDENMKPWLLEVNFSPALSVDCQADIMVKKPLLHNLMDMMNFKDSDGERGNLEKTYTGRLTGRQRGSSGRADLIDRHTSVSRLSRCSSNKVMNTTLSTKVKNIQSPVLEHTLSFIEQDNPSINKPESILCFGLPLVQPEDNDCSSTCSSGRGSVCHKDEEKHDIFSQFDVRSGRYTPASTTQTSIGLTYPTFERGMIEKAGSNISFSGRKEGSLSQRYEKASNKSFCNSDSAISSFSGSSDNSDRAQPMNAVPGSSNSNQGQEQRKTLSYQPTKLLSSEPSANNAFSIKSLRPTGNSNSLRKMSQRSALVNSPTKKSSSSNFKSKSERNPSRNFLSRSQSHYVDQSSSSDSGIEMKRGRSQLVVSSLGKTPRDTESTSRGILTNKNSTASSKNVPRNRPKSFSFQKPKPKGPPPQIGEFFLVFPFNESTLKHANSTLDAHAVIKETQKMLKEVQQDIEKHPADKCRGGFLPLGASTDGDRLWSPLKAPPPEN